MNDGRVHVLKTVIDLEVLKLKAECNPGKVIWYRYEKDTFMNGLLFVKGILFYIELSPIQGNNKTTYQVNMYCFCNNKFCKGYSTLKKGYKKQILNAMKFMKPCLGKLSKGENNA